MEEWRKVVGYDNYEVSNFGEVRNQKGEILKTFKNNSGYYCLQLYKDRKGKGFLVHRLVASAFIENPDSLPTVNHIDGIKENNSVSNLEWNSYSQNLLHARRTGLNIYNYPTRGLKHKSTVSKYYNVGYDNSRKKWTACVRVDGVNHQQKRFKTEEEAALHVNYLLDLLGLTDRPRNVI